MKWIIVITISSALLAQEFVDPIIERNPFDPSRGQQVEDMPEEPLEEAPPAVDLPILDGTIIIGDVKVALFSYKKDGRPASKRVAKNGVIQGYTVDEVSRNAVQLNAGGRAIMVTMYSGEKSSRGGTKAAVGGNRGARQPNASAQPEVITTRDTSSPEPAKPDVQTPRFRKRDQPVQRIQKVPAQSESSKKTDMDNKI